MGIDENGDDDDDAQVVVFVEIEETVVLEVNENGNVKKNFDHVEFGRSYPQK